MFTFSFEQPQLTGLYSPGIAHSTELFKTLGKLCSASDQQPQSAST